MTAFVVALAVLVWFAYEAFLARRELDRNDRIRVEIARSERVGK